MPFKCELSLGDSLPPGEVLEFVDWVPGAWNSDSEWGKVVRPGAAYAIASKGGVRGKIVTTYRCALMEKGALATGSRIDSTTVLAVVAAEGDEIAYGKSGSLFKIGAR